MKLLELDRDPEGSVEVSGDVVGRMCQSLNG